MPGRRLGSTGKQLVANVLAFFEQERDNGGPFIPITAVRERVAAALKIHLSTVTSVSNAIKNNEPFQSKKRVHKKPITEMDEFNKCAVRNIIYRMYDNNEHISVKILWQKCKEADIFQGCEKSLNTVLHNIGFKWKKDNPRRGLMELPDVVSKRLRFLKTYIRTKEEEVYKFVFLDETWIFQNGTVSRSWQDSDLRTVKSTKVDGKRYIVLHAGNNDGFIDGAELIFSSATKNADFHGEMNESNFFNWFENKLLKNLDAPSMIVLDNAPYHSITINKPPNSSWKKNNISEWLQNQGIVFEPNSLKSELLQIVAMNKPPRIYKVDQLAEQYGHKVLRLPPYHCIFNPIEQVWGITKNYYNRHIGRDGKSIQNCLDMWHEALATVTKQVWTNAIAHSEKLVQDWWEREIRFDVGDVAPLIINVDEGESDEDSTYTSDSSG